MDWNNIEYHAAILRLLLDGILKRTSKVQPLVDYLMELGWITQSPRLSELALNQHGAARLPDLLDRVWPAWRQTFQQLRDSDLPATADGLLQLTRQNRLLPPLPRRLHHKTYAAMAGDHSKSHSAKSLLPSGVELTTDGVLRLRANDGLILWFGDHRVCCDNWMAAVGEVILTERAILDGLRVSGRLPDLVMTVENLGPFVDMPKPKTFLLVHQPGWNTLLSLQFLRVLGPEVLWYHFGDLDPEGLAIYQHLNHQDLNVRLFIPSFWKEYEDAFAQTLSGGWPPSIKKSFEKPFLKKFFARNVWLEQEPIILDERFERELNRLISASKE
ncbi:MAG: hypothetical protein WCA08_20190 [Desulfoferrobacter sp.]